MNHNTPQNKNNLLNNPQQNAIFKEKLIPQTSPFPKITNQIKDINGNAFISKSGKSNVFL